VHPRAGEPQLAPPQGPEQHARRLRTSPIDEQGDRSAGAQDLRETIGVPVEELDEEEVAVFKTFCHNHLRNTCARRAIKFEAAYLTPKFAECKQRLDLSKLRVTGDVSAALRAAAKDFVFLRLRGYAKGSGLEFFSWALENAKGQYIFIIERFDLGTRFIFLAILFTSSAVFLRSFML